MAHKFWSRLEIVFSFMMQTLVKLLILKERTKIQFIVLLMQETDKDGLQEVLTTQL